MDKVVVCSCGKSLRAHEGMTDMRCPVCGKTYRTGAAGGRPAADSSNTGITVFGFDPPAPTPIPKAPLSYQVVEISSEKTTPPRPRPQPVDQDDDDARPYPVEGKEALARPAGKSQEEMWAPSIDLREDPHSPYAPNKERRPRFQTEWVLEQNWFECLAYPVRGWPLIAVLGLILTFVSFGLLQVLRHQGPAAWIFWGLGGVALAYAFGFLTCVLNAGASGVVEDVHWPGANFKILYESLLAGFMSFLAGPIVPAALAVYFWIYSGELAIVDYIILMELTVLTFGYWLLVFLSAALSDSWSSLLPAAVFQRTRRLGVARACFAVAFVNAVFFCHFHLALVALEAGPFGSFMLLLICWMSLLFWMVFLMRWLGVCLYRLKLTARRKAAGSQ